MLEAQIPSRFKQGFTSNGLAEEFHANLQAMLARVRGMKCSVCILLSGKSPEPCNVWA